MGGAPQTRVPFSGFDEPWRSPSARSERPQPYERASVAEHADDAAVRAHRRRRESNPERRNDDAAGVGSLRHARTATPDSATHPGRLRRWGANPHGNGTNARNAFRDRKGARGDTAGAHHAGSLGRRPARCEAVPFTPVRHASHRRRRSNPSSRRLQPVPPVALKRWAGPGRPTRRHRESALTRTRRRTAKVPWRRLDRADE